MNLVLLFIIVDVILYMITAFLLMNVRSKHKNYVECTGTIIDFHLSKPEMPGSHYSKEISPIVSYEVNGNKYEFIGKFYSTNMKVGKKVKVFYHKEDYSKASMKGFVYFAPLITGGIAIVFMIPIIILFMLKSNDIISF